MKNSEKQITTLAQFTFTMSQTFKSKFDIYLKIKKTNLTLNSANMVLLVHLKCVVHPIRPRTSLTTLFIHVSISMCPSVC
jgi:hypothetical protein